MTENTPITTPLVEQPADTPVETNSITNPVIEEKIAPKSFKVKIDGAEQEVSEEELLRGYQTASAAQKRMQEAAMSRKQVEEVINLLRKDPFKVLTDPSLGINARELAEKFLMQQLEDEANPKDAENRKLKQQLEQIEEEKRLARQDEEKRQAEVLIKQHTENYTKDISNALETSGLPKTNHTVKRMAYYMAEGLKRGLDLSAKDVVDYVRNDYMNDVKELFSSSDGEILLKLLGEDVAKKIRKYDLSRVSNPINKVTNTERTNSTKSNKKMSSREFFKSLQNK